MKVTIFEAAIAVGEAEIFALDPPMHVAAAKSYPSLHYDASRHANVIDGDYVGDRTPLLRLEMSSGVALRAKAISIQDLPALGEREVYITGIFEPSFDDLFHDHPDFKAYWAGS